MDNKITGGEVMSYLLPKGGWSIRDEDFSTVVFDEGVDTITEDEFKAGFATYAAWKAEQELIKANTKADLLERLGITAEEAQLLLS